MSKFVCILCEKEIVSLTHICGQKDMVGGEVLVGGTGWGKPGYSLKAGNYE